LFKSCAKVVQKLCESCSKVVRKLFKSCAKVVQKLFKSCAKVVQKLCKSCAKVVQFFLFRFERFIIVIMNLYKLTGGGEKCNEQFVIVTTHSIHRV